jgi:hypothetical protein
VKNAVEEAFKKRDAEKEEYAISFSKASKSSVDKVLSSMEMIVIETDADDVEDVDIASFDWGTGDEKKETVRATSHMTEGLTAAGVLLNQNGGYQLLDTHNFSKLLDFSSANIGKLSGGTDNIITPYRVATESLKYEACVVVEYKTTQAVTKEGRLDKFGYQALLELVAARCVSHQPSVLAILTDLSSHGAIAYETIYHTESNSYHVQKLKLRHTQLYAYIARFLNRSTFPKPDFKALPESDVVRFKKAKLINQTDSSLAWEHFEELKEDSEPWSRERGIAARDLFQSWGVETIPSVIHCSMYI